MKKATFEAIKTALTNFGFADEDILAELDKEINKGAEAKAAKDATYDAAWEVVRSVLAMTTAPLTVAEIVAERGKGRMKRIGVQDQFGQSAPYERLLEMNDITVENIIAQAKRLIAAE